MSDGVAGNPARPSGFEDRYRLYLDESGDHWFRDVAEPAHRFLCLLGCLFRNPDDLKFHEAQEELNSRILPHHPDDPGVLHREDMLSAREEFKALRDPAVRKEWDERLLGIMGAAVFRIVAVVIDTLALRKSYGETAAHPYHLGLGFLLPPETPMSKPTDHKIVPRMEAKRSGPARTAQEGDLRRLRRNGRPRRGHGDRGSAFYPAGKSEPEWMNS